MQREATTQPLTSADQQQPRTGLPRWEQLSSAERQALMISLTSIMVKQLAGQGGGKEQHDDA